MKSIVHPCRVPSEQLERTTIGRDTTSRARLAVLADSGLAEAPMNIERYLTHLMLLL